MRQFGVHWEHVYFGFILSLRVAFGRCDLCLNTKEGNPVAANCEERQQKPP
jgi:hypothetical protein